MGRLARRLHILQQKRKGAFDSTQYYFEAATRTRLSRQVRVHLRCGKPVVLMTPRWSDPCGFLDDIAVDLSLGEPSIRARPLNLAPLKGLTVHQAWAWIASAVAEFCQLSITGPSDAMSSRPIWQAVSRRGFRTVITDLFARSEGGRRRCMLMYNLEHVPVEALRDVFEVFNAHCVTFGSDRRFNLLFAGSIDAPHFELPDARKLELCDYSRSEAIEVLVETHGPLPRRRLSGVIDIVGGLPAVLKDLGRASIDDLNNLVTEHETLWHVLDSVGDEIRAAIDIVSANPTLSDRFERLVRLGCLPRDELDTPLHRAGLVSLIGPPRRPQTVVRAPWFVELVLGDETIEA